MDFAGKRILVVEDNPDALLLVSEYLTGLDFSVTRTADGQEALEALSAGNFDAAVTDVAMPRMNGIELLRRAQRDYPQVPFVVMTGYPSDQVIIDSMNAGVVRFLAKPFGLEQLKFAVCAALRAAGGELLPGDAPLEVTSHSGWVEITSPSRLDYIDRVEDLLARLSGRRMPASELKEIKIAVNEMISNAIEWGNRNEMSKPVRISYCLFPEEIVFKIEDLGPGFDLDSVPDAAADPLGVTRERAKAGKRPGGFGLAITRNLMTRLIYNDLGNCLVMSKKLNAGKPDPEA